jgi:hypothetical protein
MPASFKVNTTEYVLQQKKTNLYSKLRADYDITETQLAAVDVMLQQSDGKLGLTHFCSTHLGGSNRGSVDYKQMSAKFVSYMGVAGDKRADCCALVESYLHCFASFV